MLRGKDGGDEVGGKLDAEQSPALRAEFPPSVFQDLVQAMYDLARRKRGQRISEEILDHGDAPKIHSNPKLSVAC
jgi:hypothetical protein